MDQLYLLINEASVSAVESDSRYFIHGSRAVAHARTLRSVILCALPPTASAHEPKFELGHVSRGALALIAIYSLASVETPPVQRMTFLFNVRKGELSCSVSVSVLFRFSPPENSTGDLAFAVCVCDGGGND